MFIEQCRGARALLGWSAQDLADAARIGVATVRRYETGASVAPLSVSAMRDALVGNGVCFIEVGEASDGGGLGVRLANRASVKRLRT